MRKIIRYDNGFLAKIHINAAWALGLFPKIVDVGGNDLYEELDPLEVIAPAGVQLN